MSSSTFRAFRHTATFIVLVLMSCLADAAAVVADELSVLNRQLDGLRNGAGDEDEEDVEEGEKAKKAKRAGKKTANVFVHRYRDIDATIPGSLDCKYPGLYLDASFLRYIGWMLSDASPSVRLESIKALLVLYETPTMIPLLRPFTERFKSRFIEMAMREQNHGVRFVAIPLVTKLSEVGLIGDADRLQILPLLFSEDAKAREVVAKFVGGVWKEEVSVNAKEDAEAALGENNDMDDIGDKPEDEGGKELNIKWVEVEVQSMEEDEEQEDEDDSDEIAEEDLDDEERDAMIRKLKTLSELRDWCSGEDEFVDMNQSGSNLVALGSGNMKVAVSTLWDHVDELKVLMQCFMIGRVFLNIFHSDLTIGSGPEDDASQRELTLANIHKLSPDQEYCLILILNASLNHALTVTHEGQPRHRSKKSVDEDDDVSLKIGRILIKFIPKLLKKYGNEYDDIGQKVLSQVIRMVRHLDVMVYLELRLLKAYESLLDELIAVFLRQSGGEILREFGQTFQFLCGLSMPTNAVESPKAKKGKRALTMEVDNSASSAGLHQSATEKLEDLAEDQVAAQLLSFTNRIKAITQSSSDRIPDDLLTGFLSCLKRMKVLAQTVDSSKIRTGDDREKSPKPLFDLFYGATKLMITVNSVACQRLELLDDSDSDGFLAEINASKWTSSILSHLMELSSQDVLFTLLHLEPAAAAAPNDENTPPPFEELGSKLKRHIDLPHMLQPNPHAKMSEDLQTALLETTSLAIESVGLTDPILTSKLSHRLCMHDPILRHSLKAPTIMSPEYAESCMVNLVHLCVGVCSAVVAGLVQPCLLAAEVLQFTGVVEVSPSSAGGAGGGVGASKTYLNHPLVSAKVDVTRMAEKENDDGAVEMVRIVIEEAVEMAQEALIKLKPWKDVLGGGGDDDDDDEDKVYLQAVTTRSLLKLLRRAVDRMVEATHEAIESNDRDTSVMSLDDVNRAWTVWGAVGGLVSQIVGSFGITYEPRPEDEGIVSIDDILEYTSNSLARKGIKPVESLDVWSTYWAFTRSLENADSKLKKGRKGATTAAKKKKAVKSQGTARWTEDEEEEEEEVPLVRRPRRDVGKKEVVVQETLEIGGDEEEEEEEEEEEQEKKQKNALKPPGRSESSVLGKRRSRSASVTKEAEEDSDNEAMMDRDSDNEEDRESADDDSEGRASSPESQMRAVKRVRL
ncbi:hypothetical protein BDR26DRAFT_855411 [Obelidium mucronatum]|nr:hypothetical protein BDR26DRAFT_855411 [Obelidium mucronatum]